VSSQDIVDALDEVRAELDLVQARGNNALYVVDVACTDESETTTSIDINGFTVEDGQRVRLLWVSQGERTAVIGGVRWIWAPSFTMTVVCTDSAGNTTTVTVEPSLVPPNVQ
jgi:hypothetical protein